MSPSYSAIPILTYHNTYLDKSRTYFLNTAVKNNIKTDFFMRILIIFILKLLPDCLKTNAEVCCEANESWAPLPSRAGNSTFHWD